METPKADTDPNRPPSHPTAVRASIAALGVGLSTLLIAGLFL